MIQARPPARHIDRAWQPTPAPFARLVTQILLLLVLLDLHAHPLADSGSGSASTAQLSASDNHPLQHATAPLHPHLHHMRMCAPLLPHATPASLPSATSPREALDHLRDLMQRVQQLERDKQDREVLIQHKTVPAKEVGEEHAYGTNFTLEELQWQSNTIGLELDRTRARRDAELERLRGEGLVSGDADLGRLTSCLMGRLNPKLYPNKPVVSFMLQYFKRPWAIGKIVERIRGCLQYMKVELVVNVDEPSAHQAWAELAANSSGLVVPVFQPNVHEIRAYNRLSDLAMGRYLITHQDDEIMPLNCSWIVGVVALMDEHPNMGAMGMKGFKFNMFQDTVNAGEHFKDPRTDLTFQFVGRVDFSPMLIRRVALKQVGGLDEGLSNAGECGIWSDWELSSRLWAAGWQVGFHHLPNRENDPVALVIPSGTHKPETALRCWGRQQHLASSVYNQRWGGDAFQNEINQLVRRLNHELLTPIFRKCPFSKHVGGCDLWEDTYPPAKIESTVQLPG